MESVSAVSSTSSSASVSTSSDTSASKRSKKVQKQFCDAYVSMQLHKKKSPTAPVKRIEATSRNDDVTLSNSNRGINEKIWMVCGVKMRG